MWAGFYFAFKQVYTNYSWYITEANDYSLKIIGQKFMNYSPTQSSGRQLVFTPPL